MKLCTFMIETYKAISKNGIIYSLNSDERKIYNKIKEEEKVLKKDLSEYDARIANNMVTRGLLGRRKNPQNEIYFITKGRRKNGFERPIEKVAPPDNELKKWISDNEEKYQEKYGKQYKNKLYTKAWEKFNGAKLNESVERLTNNEDIIYINSTAQAVQFILNKRENFRGLAIDTDSGYYFTPYNESTKFNHFSMVLAAYKDGLLGDLNIEYDIDDSIQEIVNDSYPFIVSFTDIHDEADEDNYTVYYDYGDFRVYDRFEAFKYLPLYKALGKSKEYDMNGNLVGENQSLNESVHNGIDFGPFNIEDEYVFFKDSPKPLYFTISGYNYNSKGVVYLHIIYKDCDTCIPDVWLPLSDLKEMWDDGRCRLKVLKSDDTNDEDFWDGEDTINESHKLLETVTPPIYSTGDTFYDKLLNETIIIKEIDYDYDNEDYIYTCTIIDHKNKTKTTAQLLQAAVKDTYGDSLIKSQDTKEDEWDGEDLNESVNDSNFLCSKGDIIYSSNGRSYYKIVETNVSGLRYDYQEIDENGEFIEEKEGIMPLSKVQSNQHHYVLDTDINDFNEEYMQGLKISGTNILYDYWYYDNTDVNIEADDKIPLYNFREMIPCYLVTNENGKTFCVYKSVVEYEYKRSKAMLNYEDDTNNNDYWDGE